MQRVCKDQSYRRIVNKNNFDTRGPHPLFSYAGSRVWSFTLLLHIFNFAIMIDCFLYCWIRLPMIIVFYYALAIIVSRCTVFICPFAPSFLFPRQSRKHTPNTKRKQQRISQTAKLLSSRRDWEDYSHQSSDHDEPPRCCVVHACLLTAWWTRTSLFFVRSMMIHDPRRGNAEQPSRKCQRVDSVKQFQALTLVGPWISVQRSDKQQDLLLCYCSLCRILVCHLPSL